MRPRRLTFTAIGSYPGTVTVDFDALSPFGLFHISGPTGAGKSSLLDALCFSIFGKVAAPRLTERLRSDHATGAVEASATLDFSAQGVDYRILRTPAQQRPKKVGTGTTKKWPTATLLRQSGHEWLPVSDNVDEVNAHMQALVGLDAEQFMQVVVLPQGAFAEALRAGASEREKLLRTLFQTTRFGTYTDQLKARADAAKNTYTRVEQDAARRTDRVNVLARELALFGVAESSLDIATVEPSTLSAIARAARGRADHERATLVALRAEQEAQAALLQDAIRATEHWQRRVGATARLRDLESQSSTMQAVEEELKAAESILPLIPLLRDAERSGHEHDRKADEFRSILIPLQVQVLTVSNVPIGNLASVNGDDLRVLQQRAHDEEVRLQLLQQTCDEAAAADRRLRTFLQEHRCAQTELEQLSTQQETIRSAIADATLAFDADREAASMLEQWSQRLTELQAQHLAAVQLQTLTQRVEQARQRRIHAEEHSLDARRHHVALLEQRLQSMRGELAAQLADGEPCTVCGSVEHPQPALAAVTVTPGDIKAAERDASQLTSVANEALQLLQATEQQRESVRHVAENAASLPDLGANAVEEARQQVALAQEASSRVANHHTVLTAAQAELDALSTRGRAEEHRVAQLEARINDAKKETATLIERLDGADANALLQQLLAVRDIASALSRLESVRGQTEVLAAQYHEARARLTDALAEHDIASPAVVAERARSDEQLAFLRQTLDDWRSAKRAAQDTLDDPAVQKVANPPNLVEVQRAFDERQQLLDTHIAVVSRTDTLADELVALAEGLRAELVELQPLREHQDRLAMLWQLCNGGGDSRISLERYVLAAFLEEVADAASLRLQSMSSGRYRLKHSDAVARRKAASGLALLISDAYTGQEREVSTLSGGETFLASLALALGLADVVQQHAGGVVIEALFVDEGFGSLDPDTLDLAMAELDRLRAGGRLVGIISHVEALKERIPVGIEVIKGTNGSHVRIVGVDQAASA